MASSIYSINTRFRPGGVLLLAMLLLLTGCTIKKPVITDAGERPVLPPPAMFAPPGSTGQDTEARMAASHSLTREGYQLLQNKDYDSAIRVLERAVGIAPNNGPGYFYLAEAWLEKENFNLAARFNTLAVLYLRSDPNWSRQARAQTQRIERGRTGDRQGPSLPGTDR